MFKTSGSISVDTIIAIQKSLESKFRTALGYIFVAVAILCSVALFIGKEYIIAIIAFICTLCILFIRYRQRKNQTMLITQRMKENGCSGNINYTTSFEEKGIHFSNDTRNVSALYKYEDIAETRDYKNLIVLYTKGKQSIISFKRQLTGEEVDLLLEMLRNKGISIRKSDISIPLP